MQAIQGIPSPHQQSMLSGLFLMQSHQWWLHPMFLGRVLSLHSTTWRKLAFEMCNPEIPKRMLSNSSDSSTWTQNKSSGHLRSLRHLPLICSPVCQTHIQDSVHFLASLFPLPVLRPLHVPHPLNKPSRRTTWNGPKPCRRNSVIPLQIKRLQSTASEPLSRRWTSRLPPSTLGPFLEMPPNRSRQICLTTTFPLPHPLNVLLPALPAAHLLHFHE